MTTLIGIETGLTHPAPEPDLVLLIQLRNIGILRVIKWRNGDGFGVQASGFPLHCSAMSREVEGAQEEL